jgi:hypothetical protein
MRFDKLHHVREPGVPLHPDRICPTREPRVEFLASLGQDVCLMDALVREPDGVMQLNRVFRRVGRVASMFGKVRD